MLESKNTLIRINAIHYPNVMDAFMRRRSFALSKGRIITQTDKYNNMNSTQIPKGIVIDIQAVDMTINEQLQRQIFQMLEKLQKYFARISWADFYMRQSPKRTTSPRTIKVRLGIPGPDIFVSDSGKSWRSLMTRVEQKIMKQLQKRKMRV
jgi:ribosomal subunit interface protein